MAYVTLNAYDARLKIPEFVGLMQFGDMVNADPRYSPNAKNADVKGGVLQPFPSTDVKTPTLQSPIMTIARLHRRWNAENKDILVAASGGQLYYMLPDGDEWTLIPNVTTGASYLCNEWSTVTYEINDAGSDPIDVLIMSNAKDGMLYVRGDNMTAVKVETPKKFGVIARYAERIWGGAIDNDPDMLVYSAPYAPMDWEANTSIPEDGAGDVQQPSWDGDSFTALTAFGSQLIAFKKHRVWRVLGTDPGEYVFKEQYGGGATYAQTVCVDVNRILMLNKDGISVYDGADVTPYHTQYAYGVYKRINFGYADKACAVKWKNYYMVAVPIDGSTINNAVIILNTDYNSFMLRTGINVEAFLDIEERLFFTSSTSPGQVCEWYDDAFAHEECVGMEWLTPWFDFGYKNITKSAFEVYMTVEGTGAISVTVQTETKTKTKEFSVADNAGKQKRLNFALKGRRFRLKISSASTTPWKITGGIEVNAEIDKD